MNSKPRSSRAQGFRAAAMGLEERRDGSDDEGEDESAEWEDWTESEALNAKCLFCSKASSSAQQAFEHCAQEHGLDYTALRAHLKLDFYSALRLLNYIRSEVVSRRCWNCAAQFDSEKDLLDHVNSSRHFGVPLSENWKDDKYLSPFLENDPLLYGFDAGLEGEADEFDLINREELMTELATLNVVDMSTLRELVDRRETTASSSTSEPDGQHFENRPPKKEAKVKFGNVMKEEIRRVNNSYFSSYGEYGIHREMLGDKARTEAYQGAILNNPTLLKNALVMDIGCGTGILSLFAAKAGASKVIAVDGSEKMASVARQIAKDNALDNVIEVVGGMIEELDTALPLETQSVDLIVSEWMGYCLLYESMLESVLHARDRWLKPGGAILPDTAELYMAGFGKGGTSLPFWEDVYSFNMTHIGREVTEHAAETPLIDIIEERDIVTDSYCIQKFDIATMKAEDADFTANFELKPRTASSTSRCYGVVVWFDVGFTERFCKEQPVTLTTSPFAPRTHWSQTLLTFRKPIELCSEAAIGPPHGNVGSETNPATSLKGRISIARSYKHRSIDISLETVAVGRDGSSAMLPIQIFAI